MPKNPLKFARRKSSGGVLDDIPADTPSPSPAPAVSSFRVLERPDKINLNGEHGPQGTIRKVNRPFQSPLQQLRGRSAEELGVIGANRCVVESAITGVSENWLLKGYRGSGGTTNSGSSGYNESSSTSARHSSSSTLPSSVDAEREHEEEELFPRKTKTLPPMYHSSPAKVDDLPPPRPSFTSRAARALSFGQNKNASPTNGDYSIPPLPQKSYGATQRERATTNSSYASTAKPEVNLSLGTSDFGSDFSSMFDPGRNDDLPPPPPPKAAFHRTVRTRHVSKMCNTNTKQESEPMFPPRTHSRQILQDLPELKNLREDAGSPYEWDRRGSSDGLMSSSAKSSPRIDEFAPSASAYARGIAPAFLGKSKTDYSLVPDRYSPGVERTSHDLSPGFIGDGMGKRLGYDSRSEDEDTMVKRVELHDPQGSDYASSHSSISETSRSATITRKPISSMTNAPPVARKPLGMLSQATAGASRPRAPSPDDFEEDRPLWGTESSNTTPRAAKLELPNLDEESMFDSSPLGPASRAIKPQHMRTESGTPKKMTKAQFERLQRRGDGSAEQSEEGEHSGDDEYDDEDDVERAKNLARQRRKQEANMSVYRQQMKKVTGGVPQDLPSGMPRPSLDRAAASAPAAAGLLHMGGIGGQPPEAAVRGKQTEEDDDDVPLGILQAHGFPSSSRPPTRMGENDASRERRASGSGSVIAGGAGQGPLPPFARRLPADPYFGAGLVNQSHRESLGMSSAASVYGGPPGGSPMMQQQPPQMGHPGGLVGVIAGEERAKAARRGSPNPATGAFTNPGMMQPPMGGMLGMGRTMTMPNIAAPQTYTPSGMGPGSMMPGMPMMPQMPQQQMQNPQQDQMAKFMEMQMQIMQNMMAMQQQQMGQTPPPQQQAQDYLGFPSPQNPRMSISMPSQAGQVAPSVRGLTPPTPQGRAMTMMHPPTRWDVSPGIQRPNSAMPTYSPSGMNIPNGGPGAGYTPSIAPSERSNVGMPSRYRPVTTGNDGTGRTHSMTSNLTLQPPGHNQAPPPPKHGNQLQSQSTVRLIDKPKGAPKIMTKAVAADEDDDEGWAEMRKKREDKKRFRFGRRDKTGSTIGDLYHDFD